MAQPISADEKRWQAEGDANTLAEAEVIKGDKGRSKAAKGAAKKMSEEATKRAKAFSNVAGKAVTKSNTNIPGVRKKK